MLKKTKKKQKSFKNVLFCVRNAQKRLRYDFSLFSRHYFDSVCYCLGVENHQNFKPQTITEVRIARTFLFVKPPPKNKEKTKENKTSKRENKTQ